MTYQDLQNALATFGLGERATLHEIKSRHRQLVKEHHPDQSRQSDSARIQQINAAWRTLSDYCHNYRFAFDEQEFLEQVPEERLRRQFAEDPNWGGLYEEDEPS
ncbi:MAG: molecular chaperone DnaJ [Desulfuromonas sp.]|nr:MAG: molecular chaperone DnaJ [Desulfuromonas sp.]